jgi:hypothetical protein
MLPLGPAIIMVMDPPMVRAAALVYRMPDGLGWVEPGYWDEYPPSSPQWHQFAGEVTDTADGVMLRSPDQVLLVLDADRVAGTGQDDPEAQAVIAQLRLRFRELGTSFAEERERLAVQVGAVN